MSRRRKCYFTSPRVKRRRLLARAERELELGYMPPKTFVEVMEEWQQLIYKGLAIPKEYLAPWDAKRTTVPQPTVDADAS